MKGFLNQAQFEYVLSHLNNHIDLNETVKNSFVFLKYHDKISDYSNKIIFLLSDKDLDLNKIVSINQIPVLFPVADKISSFRKEDGNIIVLHDYIKSAFFLLSGYQEYVNNEKDSLGRFSYMSSVQEKLKITGKPVVNYYFVEIIKAIEEYCLMHNIKTSKKKEFNTFAFFLTHDIDRISFYNMNTLLYSLKLLFGFKKSESSRVYLLKEIIKVGLHIVNIFDKRDPYWNFEFLSEKEKELGITSTYFFLPRDRKHVDSYYNFTDKKIRNLISFLKNKGNEVGLHGTVASSESIDSLKVILKDFKSVTELSRVGIRQHKLMWHHPLTAINHSTVGIEYYTTLGFADHEGFRNSYCHPFKLFDFENNRMLPTWEIPLNVMDTTLLHYRQLSNEALIESVSEIVKEIKKFNGVFTMLWHNSSLYENAMPGITKLYFDLLGMILAEQPEIYSGLDIIKKYNSIKL